MGFPCARFCATFKLVFVGDGDGEADMPLPTLPLLGDLRFGLDEYLRSFCFRRRVSNIWGLVGCSVGQFWCVQYFSFELKMRLATS